MRSTGGGHLGSGATSAGASSGVVIGEPHDGFSFTLPVSWKQVPLNGSDITALLNAATHDDPALTNALNGQVTSATAGGVEVFAIGPLSGSTVPNVNVIVSSSGGSPTGNAFAPAAIAEAKIEFTQIGASHIKTSLVHNRLGTAAQTNSELNLKNTGPQFGDQFIVHHKPNVEIVTVSTSSLASSQSTARFIVDRWRWSRS